MSEQASQSGRVGPPGLVSYERHLGQLESAAEGFAAVLRTADLDAGVAACPGWTLRDLAWHLGGVHRWAAYALREDAPGEETQSGPDDATALSDWYRESVDDLLVALRAVDPAVPRWNFGPPPRIAGFWHRRQAHETTVHLWDAQNAAGRADPIPTDVARDGLDEIARIFFPRQVRLKRCEPLTVSLGLVATDGPGGLDGPVDRWLLRGDGLPADVLWAADGSDEGSAGSTADVVVTGPAEALLLLVWKRIGLDDDRLTVSDPAAAGAVLAMPIAP